ncbi:Aldehyde dehydrogenase [Venturia inaequalis]|nr:Aldehyde dehydrogenase [Venturia inaequalis]
MPASSMPTSSMPNSTMPASTITPPKHPINAGAMLGPIFVIIVFLVITALLTARRSRSQRWSRGRYGSHSHDMELQRWYGH